MDLLSILKPYSVICHYDNPAWWDVPGWAVTFGIQTYQKNYFGGRSDFYPPHVELFLDQNHIYDAVPPTIHWTTWEAIKNCKIKIFRPTFYRFCDEDAQFMIQEFEKAIDYEEDAMNKAISIIGCPYDLAQCAEIAVNGLLGSPNKESYKFDSGGSGKICSIGTALAFAHYRNQSLKLHGVEPYPQLFSKINGWKFDGALWRSQIFNDFANKGKVWLEMVMPAHFSNSDWFGSEFVEIARTF